MNARYFLVLEYKKREVEECNTQCSERKKTRERRKKGSFTEKIERCKKTGVRTREDEGRRERAAEIASQCFSR